MDFVETALDEHTVVLVGQADGVQIGRIDPIDLQFFTRDALAALVAAAIVRRQALAALGCCRILGCGAIELAVLDGDRVKVSFALHVREAPTRALGAGEAPTDGRGRR